MARKKRKKSFEAILIFLLTAILLTLVALLAHQMGYLKEIRLPDLPFLEWKDSSPEADREQEKEQPANADGEVKVCFIDVGQGDSTLIIAPKATVLIDGGTPANGSAIYNLLREQGVKKLDYIINTHPHSDHVGGLAQVVKKLGSGSVDRVLVTSYPEELEPDIQSWPQFLQQATEKGADIEKAQLDSTYDLGGGAELTLLGPARLYDDMNDDSIVCRLDFGEASFLFTGDSGTQALRDINDLGSNLVADILKLGHHGSNTSTDSVVLRMVEPKAAVASCGAENDYGHPHREVTSLLEEKNIPCLRTDLQGSIWMSTDGQEITITADRGQQEPLLIDAK